MLSLVLVLVAFSAAVQSAPLTHGSYKIMNRNVTTSVLVAPSRMYQSLMVQPAEDIWLLSPAPSNASLFTFSQKKTGVLTEYCEASPLMSAPVGEGSAFEVVGEDEYFTIFWPRRSYETPLAWSAVEGVGSEDGKLVIQLRTATDTVNQQWVFEAL